ncbi:MAG: hypothetical protein LC746_17580, partial [Acidobacteria bacterium]|nr:hypothetical protein [Acidobacteriota bacterium]
PITPPDPIRSANVSSLSPFVIALEPPQAALQSALDSLRALRQSVTDERDALRLDQAARSLAAALDPSLWLDPARLQTGGGQPVFEQTKNAVKRFDELASDSRATIPAATLRFYIARLLEVDRRLAAAAITDAQSAGASQPQLARAVATLTEGDADVTRNKFEEAVADYAAAWGLALKAAPVR